MAIEIGRSLRKLDSRFAPNKFDWSLAARSVLTVPRGGDLRADDRYHAGLFVVRSIHDSRRFSLLTEPILRARACGESSVSFQHENPASETAIFDGAEFVCCGVRGCIDLARVEGNSANESVACVTCANAMGKYGVPLVNYLRAFSQPR